MQQLTPEGQRIVSDLANRYGFSSDAVTHMLIAVMNGNGRMAQFNHPEFAGSGQWMSGGMLMLSDMFNHSLKGRVEGLCQALSQVLASQRGLVQAGSFQSQSQSGSGHQAQTAGGGGMGANSLFVPDPEDLWWPQDLGAPSATGSQNGVRYAYFAPAARLAVKTGRDVWVYNTLDHRIGGFAQQQGSRGSITFTSQYGTVDLSSLPVVVRQGRAVAPPANPPGPTSSLQSSPQGYRPPGPQPASAPGAAEPVTDAGPRDQPSGSQNATQGPRSHDPTEIIAALERLGDLHAKGIVTDDEFKQKKTELLSRL